MHSRLTSLCKCYPRGATSRQSQQCLFCFGSCGNVIHSSHETWAPNAWVLTRRICQRSNITLPVDQHIHKSWNVEQTIRSIACQLDARDCVIKFNADYWMLNSTQAFSHKVKVSPLEVAPLGLILIHLSRWVRTGWAQKGTNWQRHPWKL